jgi:hypothetical protein
MSLQNRDDLLVLLTCGASLRVMFPARECFPRAVWFAPQFFFLRSGRTCHALEAVCLSSQSHYIHECAAEHLSLRMQMELSIALCES